MSEWVEGKPWRYVWWCATHDSEWDGTSVWGPPGGGAMMCEQVRVTTEWDERPCRVYKMRLDPVGYVKPKWGYE